MATYDSLPQDDKDRIQSALALMRPMSAAIYRDAVDAAVVIADWNGGTSALIASLDAGELIPDTTNLNGALSLTKENVANNLMSYVSTRASFNTAEHLDNITPAAGAANIINE